MIEKSSLKSKYLKTVLVWSSALLAIFILLLMIFIFEHTPMFPAIYLTDQRKQEITAFSEKLLNTFGQDIVFVQVWTQDYYKRLGYENQLDTIEEMYQFCETTKFSMIYVSVDEELVLYRHHIAFRHVIDYQYSTNSKPSKISISRYQR